MGVYAAEQTSGFAFEALTIDNTVGGIGFTTATFNPAGGPGATAALVTTEVAQVRYRYDGGAPTATVGHLLEIGDRLKLEGSENLNRFRAIRTGASSGTLTCTFER